MYFTTPGRGSSRLSHDSVSFCQFQRLNKSQLFFYLISSCDTSLLSGYTQPGIHKPIHFLLNLWRIQVSHWLGMCSSLHFTFLGYLLSEEVSCREDMDEFHHYGWTRYYLQEFITHSPSLLVHSEIQDSDCCSSSMDTLLPVP